MATMATMATQYPLENAQPGERFSYVFVPADSNLPLEARTESAEGGLEDDKLSKSLRAGSELGPNIDITANAAILMSFLWFSLLGGTSYITVPSKVDNCVAVSMYQDGNADQKPVNTRVMGLMHACGLKTPNDIRGNAVLSRYVDNDDDIWKRVNFTVADVSSTAPWVQACAARNKGRDMTGSSLSGILSKQAEQMAAQQKQGSSSSSTTSASGVLDSSGSSENTAIDGVTWTQTPDEVEVAYATRSGTTKKDVAVAFSPQRLEIRVSGTVVLKGDLGGAVDVSGCTWTLDGQNLVVSLEKRESQDWPFSLKLDSK